MALTVFKAYKGGRVPLHPPGVRHPAFFSARTRQLPLPALKANLDGFLDPAFTPRKLGLEKEEAEERFLWSDNQVGYR
jgi:hypothetical protein